MKTGKSEFKVKIDVKGLKEISAIATARNAFSINFAKVNMTDFHTYCVIAALEDFLKERRCEPDFEVVLGE